MSLRDELLRRFPALRSLPPNTIAVGGAVRDLLLHRDPVDVDLECDSPEQCAVSLGRVIPLGRGDLKVFRTVVNGAVYDFSGRTELRRRDFTINAIAVNLTTGEVNDPWRGQADIEKRVVRMIDPQNFQDDPLRMLRAVRLAVQFDFEIDEKTSIAIRRRAAHITTVAAERVNYELNGTFSTGKLRRALVLLSETALDEALFGYSIDAGHFQADDVSLAAAYALLIRDPRAFAERWKWSDAVLREVSALQRLLRNPDLMALHAAGEGVASQVPALFAAVGRPLPSMPDFVLKPLLDGREIAEITGRVPGPEVGALKRALIEAQLRGEVTSREAAENFIRKR
jgi:tRNA nucleotidyltransferase/poly(A) polymerase